MLYFYISYQQSSFLVVFGVADYESAVKIEKFFNQRWQIEDRRPEISLQIIKMIKTRFLLIIYSWGFGVGDHESSVRLKKFFEII